MTEKNQQNSLLGKIAAYTEILAKDPGSTIFVSLSEAYRKMGMLNDARQVVEKGLETHPDFSPAHIVYARILCQQGEYDASSAAFQQALTYDSENLAALVGFARLHILLGEEVHAKSLLLQARELSPADPVINKLLLSLPDVESEPEPVAEIEDESAVEEQIDQPADQAEVEAEPETLEEVLDEEESAVPPLASSTLADLYLKQGLTDQALDMYRQLSADNPDNLEYRRKIRDIEGEPDEVSFVAPDVPEIQPETESNEPVDVEGDREVEADVTLADPVDIEGGISSSEPSLAKASDDKVLETLNRWLDSIKKRREDV
ncbi:Tetratricopeptide repeat-containing protein [Malonomonas rubra DSM 5091]|uniref:Tetratricopeptide repeat-containing protein n=1 Tax=Malonomonas rubra DSM 5091 TaxID=1122189 RepID=A0A1M6LJB2_MALRU|nr:tetratricopeptide repeat protein [Malonomonas rubra]SHJ71274.1 Tetratricopeptide repeat-containing protein [Malonomonas rubra DSM 5091]